MKSTYNSKKVHEKYHKKTKPQDKIIAKNNFTYKIILPILDKYVNTTNKKILDIGCGSGTLSLYLASKGNTVHGIDISKRAVYTSNKSAKELGLKNVSFEVLDFPRDKLRPNNYDVILLLEVIEHIEEDARALQLLYSRLNTNGILILSTPSKNAPLYRLGLTKDFDKRVGHLRRYREKELLDQIKYAGFNIIEIKKNEGILRNFLYTNSIAGNAIRFIKFFIVDLISYLDNLSMLIFGESDFIVIAKKS